jgi:hypothetical protein
MARITHVAKAQQRYEMVPKLDEAGEPIRTPVMKNGVQKTTRAGRPVFMDVTIADRNAPLPMPRCDAPGCEDREIKVGTPYKHMSPKSGPYGGRKLCRHESCPTWQVWEYSSSMGARLAQIDHDFRNSLDLSAVEDNSDVVLALEEMASNIREIADEKEEGADNIESGFGHETEQSMELRDISEQLRSWADEVESADIPDFPEPEEDDCEACDATGYVNGDVDDAEQAACEECDATGRVTPDEVSDEAREEWISEVEGAISVVDECPV